MLTDLSASNINSLQSTGKDVARQEFILRDDQLAVWNHVKTLKDARVDFILDNCT
jgi:damage-control phosphatase, subfamily III